MAVYLINGEQNTVTYIIFDIISSGLILSVGVVMVLQTISLKEGIQKSVGQLVKISNIPLILFISLTTIYITMAVMGILELKYLYFAIAGFDFIIASALFISLKMMQRVIAKVPTLEDFEGEVYARKFVTAFGFSFIVALGLNFFKSLFWLEYTRIIQEQPIEFSTICFSTNLCIEIFPILLLIVMHRRNFDPDEN